MKKLLSLLLLFVASLPCFSQTQHSIGKFSMQLKAGAAIPLGRFANKSLLFSPHDTSGNALTGFAADLLLKYQLKKSFGISLSIGESINKQDGNHFRSEIKKGLPDQAAVQVKAKSWNVFKVMAGVYYSIPFSSNSRFELVPMALVGICKTNIPAFSYGYYTSDAGAGGSYGTFSMPKQPLPVTFCYSVSMALNYKLNKRFFLLADANYFGASPVKKYSYLPMWPDVTVADREKHYSLSTLNFQIGAGVRF